MTKESTNVWTYVILTFCFVLFISGINMFAENQLKNPESNLDDASILYFDNILGGDLAKDLEKYQTTKTEIEADDTSDYTNTTGASLKDYAMEFFYARSRARTIGGVAKNIFSFPTLVANLFKIPISPMKWLFDLLNWFWRLGIFVAGYYFIRGLK